MSRSQFALIKCLLDDGSSVVVDDTNLMPAVIDRFVNVFKRYRINFKIFDVGLDTAVARNAIRTKRVEENVVRDQWDKFERMKSLYDFSPREPTQDSIEQSGNLPAAFVVDMDGTLALHQTRHVFQCE